MDDPEQKMLHSLILSAVFHYEFVIIHPFADGNDRIARLWHTAILSKWKPIFTYIPLKSQIERFQDDYYEAIAVCPKEGTSNTFIEFMLHQIDHVLDELTVHIAEYGRQQSVCVQKLLSIIDYDIPYTAVKLMEQLRLKSRNALRNNYLSLAIDLDLAEMNIPEKPNSRNYNFINQPECKHKGKYRICFPCRH